MKLTKGWKIVLGIVTLVTVVWPFVFSGIIMTVMMMQMPNLLSSSSPDFLEQFYKEIFPTIAVLYPLILCGSILQMVLMVFYILLIVTNKELTDMMRVLFIVAAFFMPFIGMPLYFFAYVLKQADSGNANKPVGPTLAS